jgi:hypothetical protein
MNKITDVSSIQMHKSHDEIINMNATDRKEGKNKQLYQSPS